MGHFYGKKSLHYHVLTTLQIYFYWVIFLYEELFLCYLRLENIEMYSHNGPIMFNLSPANKFTFLLVLFLKVQKFHINTRILIIP